MKNVLVVTFIALLVLVLPTPGNTQHRNAHRAKQLRKVQCIRVDSFGKDSSAAAFRGLVLAELVNKDQLKVINESWTEGACGDFFLRLPAVSQGSLWIAKTGEITASANLVAATGGEVLWAWGKSGNRSTADVAAQLA